MIVKQLILLLTFPVLSFAQKDTSGKRPDLKTIAYTDINWTKAEGTSFWFYYKPTHYFFKNDEFETITLENGDILTYIYESSLYALLPDYQNTAKNVEQAVEPVTTRSCVFVRLGRGGFKIFDKGKSVFDLERIGLNSIHQYVYRSRFSDKRYWIEEYDFVNGRISKPVGILSE